MSPEIDIEQLGGLRRDSIELLVNRKLDEHSNRMQPQLDRIASDAQAAVRGVERLVDPDGSNGMVQRLIKQFESFITSQDEAHRDYRSRLQKLESYGEKNSERIDAIEKKLTNDKQKDKLLDGLMRWKMTARDIGVWIGAGLGLWIAINQLLHYYHPHR